jgi:rhodanese-related sulfurtransferase
MFKPSRFAVAVLLTLALLLAACGGSTTQVIETVSPEAAAEKLAEDPAPILLDIRTPEEVAEVRIPGAVNIDFYEPTFADQIAQLDRDASYVVYCRSGNRSGQAMDLFEDLEFAEVVDVDGGIVSWYEAGFPVTSE